MRRITMIEFKEKIIYTIGFTQKNARQFFGLLKKSGANKIIDVRLNNNSQLAGFTKHEDLAFFLESILNWKYAHYLSLAPTKELLDSYKKKEISWQEYEMIFNQLMEKRNVAEKIKEEDLVGGVLLCSEHLPTNCHRRLVAEFFQKRWPDIKIKHLY